MSLIVLCHILMDSGGIKDRPAHDNDEDGNNNDSGTNKITNECQDLQTIGKQYNPHINGG